MDVKFLLYALPALLAGERYPVALQRKLGRPPHSQRRENVAAPARNSNKISCVVQPQPSCVMPSKINSYFKPNPVQQS